MGRAQTSVKTACFTNMKVLVNLGRLWDDLRHPVNRRIYKEVIYGITQVVAKDGIRGESWVGLG